MLLFMKIRLQWYRSIPSTVRQVTTTARIISAHQQRFSLCIANSYAHYVEVAFMELGINSISVVTLTSLKTRSEFMRATPSPHSTITNAI